MGASKNTSYDRDKDINRDKYNEEKNDVMRSREDTKPIDENYSEDREYNIDAKEDFAGINWRDTKESDDGDCEKNVCWDILEVTSQECRINL